MDNHRSSQQQTNKSETKLCVTVKKIQDFFYTWKRYLPKIMAESPFPSSSCNFQSRRLEFKPEFFENTKLRQPSQIDIREGRKLKIYKFFMIISWVFWLNLTFWQFSTSIPWTLASSPQKGGKTFGTFNRTFSSLFTDSRNNLKT